MPDLQYISGVTTRVGLLDRLAAWLVALLASTNLEVRLTASPTIITSSTTLIDITEATYSGYSPINVTAFNGTWLDPAGNAYASTNLLDFVCNGLGNTNTVYGAILTQSIAGGVAATATATVTSGAVTSVVPGSAGSGYLFPPRVAVTGGGGQGAVITATVANGIVTGYTIVSPGFGYTSAPTLTVDAPRKLVAGANFAAPIRMAFATDACPVMLQVTELID